MDKYHLIHSMRCPKCGNNGAYVVIEDDDWWVATCDECGLHEGEDPTKMLDELFPDWYDHMPQTAKLKAENAKLRELVSILVFCTNETAHDCDRCAMNGEDLCMTVPEWLFCDGLTERLRAIGFEVTE